MTLTLVALLAVFAFWMLVCGWCGFRARALAFFGVLLVGLALNAAWMVLGLDARVFEPYALVAQVSLILYGVGGFGVGWLIGRFMRRWRDSQVDDNTV